MYENYASQHPLDASKLNPSLDQQFNTGPYAPYMQSCGAYWAGGYPFLTPIWYTDWRDETLSWHLTCSLHAHLNPSPVTIIRGPEAAKFLKENFVNNIDNFPIGVIKHGIMCIDNGLIATHGVLMRVDEDCYEAFWHAPYIDYAFASGNYDATLEDITSTRYLFQLQGPRSLEILEELTGDDLHDIDYRHFRESSIDGNKVRILRFGMSGGLAYEIHGQIEHAKDVYKKIIEIGNPYGIRPIGLTAYMMDHTPGGFPQSGNNIMSAMFLDEKFQAYVKAQSDDDSFGYADMASMTEMTGSAGPDPRNHMFNPFEIGLGHCINWNHDFRGKEALQEYAKTKKRGIVTLEWNVEDIITVYASQFQDEEDIYRPMDFPGTESPIVGHFTQSVDLVYDKDGKEIGLSFGRTQSHYYRNMLSMASIDSDAQELGNEVFVLWGNPGTRQIKIRAKVVPFPYNQHIANDKFDVNTIPKLK